MKIEKDPMGQTIRTTFFFCAEKNFFFFTNCKKGIEKMRDLRTVSAPVV